MSYKTGILKFHTLASIMKVITVCYTIYHNAVKKNRPVVCDKKISPSGKQLSLPTYLQSKCPRQSTIQLNVPKLIIEKMSIHKKAGQMTADELTSRRTFTLINGSAVAPFKMPKQFFLPFFVPNSSNSYYSHTPNCNNVVIEKCKKNK